MQKRNKKGFTLAELLIVVAIIAVLVAIAVPLFVGALDDAKEDVFNANMRSARSLAVKEIMTNNDAYKKGEGTDGSKTWYVSAEIDAQGNITIKDFEPTAKTQTEFKDYTPATKDTPAKIVVEIKESEVTVNKSVSP